MDGVTAPEQALQEFHDRAAKMLETKGKLGKEVLDLLFCVEQATQALKTPESVQAGPSVPDDADATEKAVRCNSQGQQHYAARAWRAALSCFSEAAQKAPKEAVYHANMAAAALKLCQYHTALQAAQRALCLSPEDQKVRVREAKALEGLQRWALAEEAWQGLALKASLPGKATAFKTKQERCREARKKAELEGASMVDDRPALPQGPVNVSLLSEQMEAAHIAVCNQPHSQVAKAVLVECLIQCGRLQDVRAATESLAPCLHQIYLQAEVMLRMGDIHAALEFLSNYQDDPARLLAPGNTSSPASTPASAAAPAHASSPAPGPVPTAGQAKLQGLKSTCLHLLQLWNAVARSVPQPTTSCLMPGQPEEETGEVKANHVPGCHESTGSQAQHVQACQALLTAAQHHTPHSPLLAKAHCMLAEAWLAGPEGGPKTALQILSQAPQDEPCMCSIMLILSQAPQDEPCVLWTKACVERALGLTEPAFITLRHLQTLSPGWPGLMSALQKAAAAAAAAAATHDAGSNGCSWGGSSTRGTSKGPEDTEGSTGRGFQGGGDSSTSTNSGSGKMSVSEAYSLLGLRAEKGGHSFNKADLGRAFRRQAAVLHPDSGAARAASMCDPSREVGGASSADNFIRLREAYELLSEKLG